MGLLRGDVTGYRTGCRRRGGRTEADPFQNPQYPDQTERRFGIGVEGDGEIQCGCWVFQYKKITDGIYTRRLAGYKFVATLVPSRHQGNVALFYWDFHTFAVELIRQFCAKVITCQM